jgi:hypothetical protein
MLDLPQFPYICKPCPIFLSMQGMSNFSFQCSCSQRSPGE